MTEEKQPTEDIAFLLPEINQAILVLLSFFSSIKIRLGMME